MDNFFAVYELKLNLRPLQYRLKLNIPSENRIDHTNTIMFLPLPRHSNPRSQLTHGRRVGGAI
jgi:hypothetical protein